MMCCCSQSTRLLLWKALFRVIAFVVIAVTGGGIFSRVERSNAVNNLKTKEELIESLKKEMEKKYNMIQSDIDNFMQMSNDARNLDGPAWSYFEGMRFAFETLTTIGKFNVQSSQKFLVKLYIQITYYPLTKLT